MKVTIALSIESTEMIAKLSEMIGVSANVIAARMLNSQLESLQGLHEYLNPVGSGPVSLNIPPGNPHQPRQEVSSPLLQPGEDFVKPYEKPIRERLTKKEFLEEYKPIEGC